MKKLFIVIVSIFTLGLFGCLTSDDSTSEEIKSSSSDATLSSSSEEIKSSSSDATLSSSSEEKNDTGDVKSKEGCFQQKIIIDSLEIYSWIDEYSDGKKDTVFQPIRSYQIIGLSPTYESWGISNFVGTEMVENPILTGGMPSNIYRNSKSYDTVEVCLGDSLYHWKDSLKSTVTITEIIDTVYLNYTENAVYDKKIESTIEFANEEEILAAMDTLYYGVTGQGILPIVKHLENDQADLKIEYITDVDDSIIKGEYFSNYECEVQKFEIFDPCKKMEPCPIVMDGSSFKVLKTNSIPKIEGDELKWRLIASNRLGFADTIEVTSKLVTAVCPVQEE